MLRALRNCLPDHSYFNGHIGHIELLIMLQFAPAVCRNCILCVPRSLSPVQLSVVHLYFGQQAYYQCIVAVTSSRAEPSLAALLRPMVN
jgi:hypothetical protein